MSAVISECGRYRYQLQRQATVANPSAASAVFCMLNPSTADAEIDDPTIRRCRSFAGRWDCAGLIVVNLYALRATDPRELRRVGYADAVGPENDNWLRDAASRAGDVICAWGTNADIERVRQAVDIFRSARARLWCLGTTKDGHPRHPLYIRSDAKAIEWTPPANT